MKKIGKVILAIFILLYTFVAILLTLCLFNLNDAGYAEFDLATLIPITENFSSEYKEGDLILVSKLTRSKSDVKIGDGIFYYTPTTYEVEYGVVSKIIDESENNQTLVVGSDYDVYYNYFIGNNITNFGHIGNLYEILTSQFGYLALVILPTLVAVVVEIYAIVMEIIALRNEANYEKIKKEEEIRHQLRSEMSSQPTEVKEEKTLSEEELREQIRREEAEKIREQIRQEELAKLKEEIHENEKEN